MDTQKNAPLTPKGREMVRAVLDEGLSKASAARRFNTTQKTAVKWILRFRVQAVAIATQEYHPSVLHISRPRFWDRRLSWRTAAPFDRRSER